MRLWCICCSMHGLCGLRCYSGLPLAQPLTKQQQHETAAGQIKGGAIAGMARGELHIAQYEANASDFCFGTYSNVVRVIATKANTFAT